MPKPQSYLEKLVFLYEQFVLCGVDDQEAYEAAHVLLSKENDELSKEEKLFTEPIIRRWIERNTSLTARERKDVYFSMLVQNEVSCLDAKRIAETMVFGVIEDLTETEKQLAQSMSKEFTNRQIHWAAFYRRLKELQPDS